MMAGLRIVRSEMKAAPVGVGSTSRGPDPQPSCERPWAMTSTIAIVPLGEVLPNRRRHSPPSFGMPTRTPELIAIR